MTDHNWLSGYSEFNQLQITPPITGSYATLRVKSKLTSYKIVILKSLMNSKSVQEWLSNNKRLPQINVTRQLNRVKCN